MCGIYLNILEAQPDYLKINCEINGGNLKIIFSFELFTSISELVGIRDKLRNFDPLGIKSTSVFQIGAFKPEIAGGALYIKLESSRTKKIEIFVKGQGEFFMANENLVAAESSLVLQMEPVQFDNFMEQLDLFLKSKLNLIVFEALNY